MVARKTGFSTGKRSFHKILLSETQLDMMEEEQ
jgi:hypothetical protein